MGEYGAPVHLKGGLQNSFYKKIYELVYILLLVSVLSVYNFNKDVLLRVLNEFQFQAVVVLGYLLEQLKLLLLFYKPVLLVQFWKCFVVVKYGGYLRCLQILAGLLHLLLDNIGQFGVPKESL